MLMYLSGHIFISRLNTLRVLMKTVLDNTRKKMLLRFNIFRFISFPLTLILLLALSPPSSLSAPKNVQPVLNNFPLPKTVRLCGELMPLEDLDVWEMLDREFTISVWNRAQVFMWLKRAGRYFPYIEKKLLEENMPEDIKYLVVAESALLVNVRSGKGAVGPWQFLASTARHNGLRKDRMMDDRLDFERSTEAALRYLKHLRTLFDSWTLAMAAYNCGKTRLKKTIKIQKVKDFYRLDLPLETERYIFRIAAIKIIMENPEHYGYAISSNRVYGPPKCDSVKVKVRKPIHITDLAVMLDTDFKKIKELNLHIRGHYLPTGKYIVRVPEGKGRLLASVLEKLSRGKISRRRIDTSDGYYVVRPGDTLSHIAKRTGVSVAKLRKLNGIRGSIIREGQRIRLTY